MPFKKGRVRLTTALTFNCSASLPKLEEVQYKEKSNQGTEATSTTAATYSMQTTDSDQISSLTKSIRLLAEDNKSMKEANEKLVEEMARREKRMEQKFDNKVNEVAKKCEDMEKRMDMAHAKILACTEDRNTNMTTKMDSSFAIINNSLLTLTKTLNLFASKGAVSVSEISLPIFTQSQNSASVADTSMPPAPTAGKRSREAGELPPNIGHDPGSEQSNPPLL